MREPVPRLDRLASPGLVEGAIKLREQITPTINADFGDVTSQPQPLDVVTGRSRVANKALWLPHLAEEPRGLASGRHVVVEPHHVRNPDRRQRGELLARLEHLHDGAEV